jgi:adenosylcobinamide-phosphate synthase
MALAGNLAILALALVVDRLVGDPPLLWARVPHPVVVMGRAIGWLDERLNVPGSDAARRRRGIAALLLIVAVAASLGLLVQALLAAFPLGFLVEALLAATLLAEKSLVAHAREVHRALVVEGLAGGRRAVARIVGRDVAVLDEAGVARAAVESAAENLSDGVVAPAFWFALLGLPGILVYKAVNTADSMIGHRTPRHESFGWAAARFDDLLNLAPARLTALLIALAAWLVGCDGAAALRTAWRDAPKHVSPNAGWPEAALAGALALALGGPRIYGDHAVDGAWLNAVGRREAVPADIEAAIRLVDATWLVMTAFAAAAALLIALAR